MSRCPHCKNILDDKSYVLTSDDGYNRVKIFYCDECKKQIELPYCYCIPEKRLNKTEKERFNKLTKGRNVLYTH